MTFVDFFLSILSELLTNLSPYHVSIQYLLTPPLTFWSLRTGGSYELYWAVLWSRIPMIPPFKECNWNVLVCLSHCTPVAKISFRQKYFLLLCSVCVQWEDQLCSSCTGTRATLPVASVFAWLTGRGPCFVNLHSSVRNLLWVCSGLSLLKESQCPHNSDWLLWLV